jgi:hypothetical protein
VNPYIYLHEIVRTVPGREEPYLASVLSLLYDPTRSHGEGHAAFAQFRAVETSGPWPLGINIWQNTWAEQTEALISQFLDTRRDTAMEEWWNRNLHLRRGGYDRLLIPAPYSPTLADLIARSVTGAVFLHEIMWVPFGEPRRYLDAVERELLPMLERFGLTLVGAFRVAMRPRQVVTIIGAREWSQLAAFLKMSNVEPALQRWNDYRAEIVEHAEEMLLLPARHGPLVARGS